MPTESGLQWLSEAAKLQVCPLCVAARDFDDQYLHRFCQSLKYQRDQVAAFVRAPGFCSAHAAQFERAALNGEASLADVLEIYLKTLDAVANQLAELEQDGWLKTMECPVCVSRDHRLVDAARTLIAALERVPSAVGETLQAGGLCTAHFVMTWVGSNETADRNLLRDIQGKATADEIQRLCEARASGPEDVPDREHQLLQACRRAARAVSGWTATRH